MSTPRASSGWTLASLLADLEQQAAGHAHSERDQEVSALAVASYAEVTLAARLHGALHRSADGADAGGVPVLDVRLHGGEHLRGRLVRVGSDFFVLEAEESANQWAVATAALIGVMGLGQRALLADARPLPARVGLRSILRELAEQQCEVSVVLRDGGRLRAQVLRVGADFAEFGSHDQLPSLIPLGAVAALCLR